MTTSISGVFHRFCKSANSAHKQREKRWYVCTIMVLLHIYSKCLGVRLQVWHVNKNKVLMLIKLRVIYISGGYTGLNSHEVSMIVRKYS